MSLPTSLNRITVGLKPGCECPSSVQCKLFKSNHSGIETNHQLLSRLLYCGFKSNHSGIETSFKLPHSGARLPFKSNHSGIETGKNYHYRYICQNSLNRITVGLKQVRKNRCPRINNSLNRITVGLKPRQDTA